MSYILTAIGVIAWIAVLGFSMFAIFDGIDEGNFVKAFLGLIGLIACVAVLVYASENDPNKDKPCVRYETTMQYNAALKMTMPMRFCAEYGEWVTK